MNDDQETHKLNDGNTDGDIPYLQRLYDRPFLLLGAGLLVMFGFYTVWGLFEVMSLPQAQLP